jgi:hypothetical protein
MQENPNQIKIFFERLKTNPFNCRLNIGTEFASRLSKDGKHEIIKIVKTLTISLKPFFPTSQFDRFPSSKNLNT